MEELNLDDFSSLGLCADGFLINNFGMSNRYCRYSNRLLGCKQMVVEMTSSAAEQRLIFDIQQMICNY